MLAWTSPRPKSAPGTFTGRNTVAPGATSLLSMLPPCDPAYMLLTGSPAGAVPMVPIIGRIGKRISGVNTTSFPSTRRIFAWERSTTPVTRPQVGRIVV